MSSIVLPRDELKLSDYLWFALILGFGLWWAVFPQSVVNFYTRLHRGRVKMPGIFVVRLVGVFWMLLMFIVEVIALEK